MVPLLRIPNRIQMSQKNQTISYLFLLLLLVKSSFSEKATKIRKNIPLVMTQLSKNSSSVKTGGSFFEILCPPHNILTLKP